VRRKQENKLPSRQRRTDYGHNPRKYLHQSQVQGDRSNMQTRTMRRKQPDETRAVTLGKKMYVYRIDASHVKLEKKPSLLIFGLPETPIKPLPKTEEE